MGGSDFLTTCRARGESDGAFWAQGHSTKRLEIEVASTGSLPGLDLHAEIVVARLARQMAGDLLDGRRAFKEGFRAGIRSHLESRKRR